jgi:flagellar protein FlgJ
MTQLINNQLEGLISLQKLQTEQSAQAKDFQTAKDTSVNGSNAELKAVADQFEAIFLEMLLKQARDSKLSDGLFENKQDDNFVKLFDQELAKSSSEKVDIGIAESIIKQMAVHGLAK